jgi:hypothetical protein
MLNDKAILLAAVLLLLTAGSATAQQQQQQPIGPFVVDLKGVFARHKQEPSVASALDVASANLPTHSFGFAGGIHFYPLHTGRVTFGFGGHVLFANGSHTLDTAAGAAPSPTVERHFRAFAPEVSFNFGHRNGWSYISGGLGQSRLFVNRQDRPETSPQSRKTIHYGAGARWFTHHRVAVSLAVRWYAVSPQAATATSIEEPRTTLMVLSGGIAIR